MSESRKQFTFYSSFYEAVSKIKKKADRADAYDAICAYAINGIEPDFDKISDTAAIVFALIKPNLDASKRKAESGKKGGKSASKAEANDKQNESKSKARANEEQGENATVKEKEKEKEVEIEKEKEKENECYIYLTSPNGDVCPTADAVKRVVEAWNALDICPISKIVSGSNRHTWLKARLKEYGEDAVLQAIDNVKSSDFLTGKTKEAFKITFDWFIRPNNFPKVLDGNYNDRKEQNNDGAEEQLTGKYGQYF